LIELFRFIFCSLIACRVAGRNYKLIVIGMRSRGGTLFLIALILLINQSTYSQTCCSGGVPLAANIGLPASEKGSWQFSIGYDYNQLRTLKSGSVELPDLLRERLTQSVLFETGYTFSNRFSADLFLTYVIQERNIFTPLGTNSTVTSGAGDGVLLIKYNLLLNNSMNTALIGIGPKIPIGVTNKTSENGIALPADLQPGSGAWDVVFWGSFSRSLGFRPSLSVFGTSTYRATGVNPDYLGSIRYEFGNDLQIIAGFADRVVIGSSIWDPSLALRYRNAQRDINNGVEIEATGGQWFFLTPGLKYSINSNFSLNASMELPLYSFVNNTQLTPTNRFLLAVYYKLLKE
jgi:hypothetical protein